jgi:hypothetical protein
MERVGGAVPTGVLLEDSIVREESLVELRARLITICSLLSRPVPLRRLEGLYHLFH